MKKTILLFLITLSLALAAVVADPVSIHYSVPDPVVAGVPFETIVSMNTQSLNVLSYNLFVTSSNQQLLFSSARRGQLFPQNDLDPNSGPKDNGVVYRYQVKPKVGYEALTDQPNSLFHLGTTLSGLQPSAIQLKQEGAQIHSDNVVTPSQVGRTAEITDNSFLITPQLSICGDGVVGYLDANLNGIKEGTETSEACDTGAADGSTEDDGYFANRDGCSADCKYVDIDFGCTNTNFGERNSVCTKLPAKQILINRVTALIRGECYRPNHGFPEYCVDGQPSIQYDAQGKINGQTKINLVAQVGIALRNFFRETSQQ